MTNDPYVPPYISPARMAAAKAAAERAREEAITAAFAAIGRFVVRLWRGLAAYLRKRVAESPPISPWLTHRF